MKKYIVWFLVFLTLTIGCIYFLIPSKIVISGISSAEVTINGAYRFISEEDKWQQWWRDINGKSHVPGEPYSYSGAQFHVLKHTNNVIGIEIVEDEMKLSCLVHLISFSQDSTGIIWQCDMPATNNPLKRLSYYKKGTEIKRKMSAVIKKYTSFISVPFNVYGIIIFGTSFRDTTLLSTRFTSSSYPTTTELYGYFDVLEKNIKNQKGKVTGAPIMNVREMEDGKFETQVAIPTDRQLENKGKIVYRRMVPGNFVSAEVHGGLYTINEALKQMNFFISENNKSQIASPFQLLVTNRLEESDTTKWITKLYIPVVK